MDLVKIATHIAEEHDKRGEIQVRDPKNGHTVAVSNNPPLEAVLFEDDHLAVYGDTKKYIWLDAKEVVWVGTKNTDYWIGKLKPNVKEFDCVVHIGYSDKLFRWHLNVVG
jgi:hypothetical protein